MGFNGFTILAHFFQADLFALGLAGLTRSFVFSKQTFTIFCGKRVRPTAQSGNVTVIQAGKRRGHF